VALRHRVEGRDREGRLPHSWQVPRLVSMQTNTEWCEIFCGETTGVSRWPAANWGGPPLNWGLGSGRLAAVPREYWLPGGPFRDRRTIPPQRQQPARQPNAWRCLLRRGRELSDGSGLRHAIRARQRYLFLVAVPPARGRIDATTGALISVLTLCGAPGAGRPSKHDRVTAQAGHRNWVGSP
jgi:hypothetical protein